MQKIPHAALPPQSDTPVMRWPAAADPFAAALEFGAGTVLAVLVATHGPAYRDPGAALAMAADGRIAGAISAGCIEADLLAQAAEVRHSGAARLLRYGEGSPFFDLKLPCGGAIEVLLLRVDDPAPLRQVAADRQARRPARLHLSGQGGAGYVLSFRPGLRCIILGDGAEAGVFAGLLQGLAVDHLLIPGRALPDLAGLALDDRCAVLLFYHDHDREPALLLQALQTPAFYIGAQGSRATHARRLQGLSQRGVPAEQLARLRGPIGMIRSTRDPVRLAVSVLAEILDELPPDLALAPV